RPVHADKFSRPRRLGLRRTALHGPCAQFSMASDHLITVAVVDDNRLVREALAAMLDRLPDIRGVAADAVSVEFLDATAPNVVLLDVGLGDEDSLATATAIMTHAPHVKVIV